MNATVNYWALSVFSGTSWTRKSPFSTLKGILFYPEPGLQMSHLFSNSGNNPKLEKPSTAPPLWATPSLVIILNSLPHDKLPDSNKFIPQKNCV